MEFPVSMMLEDVVWMNRLEFTEAEVRCHIYASSMSGTKAQEEQITNQESEHTMHPVDEGYRRKSYRRLEKYNESTFKDSGYQGDDEDDFSDLKSAVSELNGELLKKQSMITELENRIVQLRNEASMMKMELDNEKEEQDLSMIKNLHLREKLINEKVKTTEKHLNERRVYLESTKRSIQYLEKESKENMQMKYPYEEYR